MPQSQSCFFVEYHGVHICVPHKHFASSVLGENLKYEPHVFDDLLNSVKPNAYFVDIGANIGIYSLLAARRVGSRGRVYAIELGVVAMKAMLLSIQRNDLRNIVPINMAASDEVGLNLILKNEEDTNIAARVLTPGDEVNSLPDPQNFSIAPAFPLDMVLQNLSRLDVVKIDVEGFEYPAMKGFSGSISRFKPLIFSEFSPYYQKDVVGNDGSEYLEFIFRFGYEGTVLHRDGQKENVAKDITRILRICENYLEKGIGHIDIMFVPSI